MSLDGFGQVHSRYGAELDTQRLQIDGKDIRHEDDEQQLEPERGASGNVGCIVSYPAC
jgi:hypothetical protein